MAKTYSARLPSAFGNSAVVGWPSFAASAATVAVAAACFPDAAVFVVAGSPAVVSAAQQEFLTDLLVSSPLHPSGFVFFLLSLLAEPFLYLLSSS